MMLLSSRPLPSPEKFMPLMLMVVYLKGGDGQSPMVGAWRTPTIDRRSLTIDSLSISGAREPAVEPGWPAPTPTCPPAAGSGSSSDSRLLVPHSCHGFEIRMMKDFPPRLPTS